MQAFSLCVVAMKFSTDHSVVFPLASAFIGNRCSRYWARDFVDWSAKFIAFPLSAVVIAPYISVSDTGFSKEYSIHYATQVLRHGHRTYHLTTRFAFGMIWHREYSRKKRDWHVKIIG
jgi:hypothetical protein